MADLTAQKTLVKSPPELWSELSEVESLAKHLGELGEITITKVEPESTVAWEGEEVSGTVELEQSGWGTKVTFRATVPELGPAAVAEPIEVVAAEPEPEPQPEPAAIEPPAEAPGPKQGFFARWLFRRRQPLPEPPVEPEPEAAVEPEPVAVEPEPPVAPDPEPVATADTERVQRVLDGTLEALGQAHHRPFSRG
ncbi:MAG TPA: hypothetical protein VEW67_09005 [Thermoleophilaceae bacterium]|nr:hypothetical protein [Thermoleophilaceae bacterium]